MQTLSHQGTAISFSEEQKQEKRRSILDLIAAAAAAHPKQGWDVVAKETGFTRKAMEMTGRDPELRGCPLHGRLNPVRG